MALRRRKRDPEPPERENVDLEAPEHAWWAAGSTDPFAHRAEPPPEPPPPPTEPEAEPAPAGRDPYEVLRVASTAPWEDIVASHRKLVRRWHPDGLGEGSTEEEREYCASRMREVTEAYQAVRVRRNR